MPDLTEMAKGVAEEATHPYYPIGAAIADWAPNESSVLTLLGAFFSACVVLFTTTYVVVKRMQPALRSGELLTIMWFVLSGAIHIFFEGYYVTHFAQLGSQQTFIAQMWKEYAFSDARYLTSNGLVFCLEAITVLCWGPGCLLVAALIVLRSPWRHSLQIIVSLGQLYGDTLYYATAVFDDMVHGISHSRPEAFYYWFYFVFMNSLWIVIPGALIIQSSKATALAISATNQTASSKKSR